MKLRIVGHKLGTLIVRPVFTFLERVPCSAEVHFKVIFRRKHEATGAGAPLIPWSYLQCPFIPLLFFPFVVYCFFLF